MWERSPELTCAPQASAARRACILPSNHHHRPPAVSFLPPFPSLLGPSWCNISMFSVPHTPGSPGFGDESGMTLVSPSQRDIKPSFAELEAMSPAEIAAVQGKLNLRLGPEYIAQRPSPGGGGKLTYVEGWRIIMLANEVFGYNGWSSSIVKLETDFCDVNEEYGTRRVSCGISAMVRVTLKDGTYHEDVGYGTADNLKSKGAALDKVSLTDGHSCYYC